jgi:hypothetical protein
MILRTITTMANTQQFQRRSSLATVAAPARFIVGRDGHGGWIVQDRQGLVGGLFANEAAALRFAAEECNRNPADICRAPEGVTLDLDCTAPIAANLH